MNKQALISVVIPCYNQALFMEETVQSVLDSVYPFIEIILVNDGSTDNTDEVGKRLEQKFPNVFYCYQQNSGPSVARNNGIKKANGIYILPLDSDDLISKEYIPEAIKKFEQDEEIKVVYCESEKFGEKTGKWNLKPFSLALLARDNMIFVSAIFKKSDWQKCGGYSEVLAWGWEDWEFWIRMLKHNGKVVKLPFTGFYYQIRGGSRRKRMTKERKRAVISYINTHHSDFIRQQLNGPLRVQRTHSKKINTFLKNFRLLK